MDLSFQLDNNSNNIDYPIQREVVKLVANGETEFVTATNDETGFCGAINCFQPTTKRCCYVRVNPRNGVQFICKMWFCSNHGSNYCCNGCKKYGSLAELYYYHLLPATPLITKQVIYSMEPIKRDLVVNTRKELDKNLLREIFSNMNLVIQEKYYEGSSLTINTDQLGKELEYLRQSIIDVIVSEYKKADWDIEYNKSGYFVIGGASYTEKVANNTNLVSAFGANVARSIISESDGHGIVTSR